MTLYVLGSMYLLVVLLFLLAKGVRFAFPIFWSVAPQYEGTHPIVPTEKRISGRPDSQRELQATVDPRARVPKEIEHRLKTEASRVEIPTVQTSPKFNSGETNIDEIMQEVQRLLDLEHVTNEDKEALETHQRGYFAHQYAAKSQLSQSNMDGFRREMKCASYELADLEEILRKYDSVVVKHGQKLFFV